MLCRAFKHLVANKDPQIVDWFSQFTGSGLISMSTLDDKLTFSATIGQEVNITAWSEFEIISTLETDEDTSKAVLAAWGLCRFLDRNDETDTMLREFVKSETGVALEPSPFTVVSAGLGTICEGKFCKGKVKSSENVGLDVDTDQLIVILPTTSKALRQLFFKRLRRISV